MNEERGRFLRQPEVIRETGLSKSTIRRQEMKGAFPKRIKVSDNASGWWSADIDRWKSERRSAPH